MFRVLLALGIVLTPHWEVAYPGLPGAASQPRHHRVEILAFQFHPNQVFVVPGDTIVWINRDIVLHTVTEHGGTWGSRPLEEGESWEIVVGHNAYSTYFCEFHPHMMGVLASQKTSLAGPNTR